MNQNQVDVMVKEEKAVEEKRKAKAKMTKAGKEAASAEVPGAKNEGKKAEVGKTTKQQNTGHATAPEDVAMPSPNPETRKDEKAPITKADTSAKSETKVVRGTKKVSTKKAPSRVFVARGKRKESVARATIRAGKGVVRINSQNLSAINNPYIKEIIREPLRHVGPEANDVDISVNVKGGGTMGQAQAARTAIANALVLYFDQMNLRQKFIGIDRSLVIEDTRRVEPKKYRGPKARARFQKSYR